jgi:hypothetical protein
MPIDSGYSSEHGPHATEATRGCRGGASLLLQAKYQYETGARQRHYSRSTNGATADAHAIVDRLDGQRQQGLMAHEPTGPAPPSTAIATRLHR